MIVGEHAMGSALDWSLKEKSSLKKKLQFYLIPKILKYKVQSSSTEKGRCKIIYNSELS